MRSVKINHNIPAANQDTCFSVFEQFHFKTLCSNNDLRIISHNKDEEISSLNDNGYR